MGEHPSSDEATLNNATMPSARVPHSSRLTTTPEDSVQVNWSKDIGTGRLYSVLVGNIIHGRYRVIKELDRGRSGTTWLCYDQRDSEKRWKALRIIAPEASSEMQGYMLITKHANGRRTSGEMHGDYICWPTGHFWLRRLNGQHLVLVMELFGPSIDSSSQNDPERIRRICLQVAKGLQYLHSHGICHGNLTPSHIHFRLNDDVNRISESEMDSLLELPEEKHDDTGSGRWLGGLQRFVSMEEVCIAGFSMASCASQPPTPLKIATRYAAPELLLKSETNHGNDIWSFACLITEIRTGKKVFDVGDGDHVAAVTEYESYLGPLPESYQCGPKIKLKNNEKHHCTGGGLGTKDVAVNEDRQPASSKAIVSQLQMQQPSLYEMPQQFKSIYTTISEEIVPCASISRAGGLDHRNPVQRHRLSRAEVLILGDLLSRIFKYNPEERLTIGEIIEHSWFGSRFRRSSEVVPEPPLADTLLSQTENSFIPIRTQYEVEGNRARARHRKFPLAKTIDLENFESENGVKSRQITPELQSGHGRKFGLINTRAAVLIIGLTMITMVWVILILAETPPLTNHLTWSYNTLLVKRIRSSTLGDNADCKGIGSTYMPTENTSMIDDVHLEL